jgi:hypothetical protein
MNWMLILRWLPLFGALALLGYMICDGFRDDCEDISEEDWLQALEDKDEKEKKA